MYPGLSTEELEVSPSLCPQEAYSPSAEDRYIGE